MRLLFHALMQLIRHPFLLIAVSWTLPATLLGMDLIAFYTPPRDFTAGTLLVIFGLLIFYIVMAVLVSIAWHRNILLEDRARTDPSWKGAFWRYFGWSILLGILMAIFAGLLGMIWLPILREGFGIELWAIEGSRAFGNWRLVFHEYIALLTAPLIILPAWFTLRLALILPGTAIGYPLYMLRSWRMTRVLNGEIFVAALVMSGLSLISTWYLQTLPVTPINTVIDVAYNWFLSMLWLAVVTVMFEVSVPKLEVFEDE